MKNLIVFLIAFLICHLYYAQKPITGIDFGYQVGKEHIFEAGLNLSLMVKKPVVTELSIGIEDDINSKLMGYKIGLMAYDGLGVSTQSPNAKPIPILVGLSIISYQFSDQSAIVFRPELGIRGIYRHGRGYTIVKLAYGYNFIDEEYQNQFNKHLIRVSFNTYWRSFFDIFRYIIY